MKTNIKALEVINVLNLTYNLKFCSRSSVKRFNLTVNLKRVHEFSSRYCMLLSVVFLY